MSRSPGLCLEEDGGLGQRKERKRKSYRQFPSPLAPCRFPLTSGPRALTCQWRRKREGWRQEGARHRQGHSQGRLALEDSPDTSSQDSPAAQSQGVKRQLLSLQGQHGSQYLGLVAPWNF